MAQQTIRIRSVPPLKDPGAHGIISDLKAAVESLQSTLVPPQTPTDLKVFPIPGGNQVQFARTNATNFRIYHSTTSNRADATFVDIGTSNTYNDQVGAGGVNKWYWVEALSSNQVSPLVGPVQSVTLALGTSAPALPVAPIGQQVFDTTIGRVRPTVFNQDHATPPQSRGV